MIVVATWRQPIDNLNGTRPALHIDWLVCPRASWQPVHPQRHLGPAGPSPKEIAVNLHIPL